MRLFAHLFAAQRAEQFGQRDARRLVDEAKAKPGVHLGEMLANDGVKRHVMHRSERASTLVGVEAVFSHDRAPRVFHEATASPVAESLRAPCPRRKQGVTKRSARGDCPPGAVLGNYALHDPRTSPVTFRDSTSYCVPPASSAFTAVFPSFTVWAI